MFSPLFEKNSYWSWLWWDTFLGKKCLYLFSFTCSHTFLWHHYLDNPIRPKVPFHATIVIYAQLWYPMVLRMRASILSPKNTTCIDLVNVEKPSLEAIPSFLWPLICYYVEGQQCPHPLANRILDYKGNGLATYFIRTCTNNLINASGCHQPKKDD